MLDNDLCETPQPTQQSVLNRSGKDKFVLILSLPEVLKQQSVTNSAIDLDDLQVSIFGTIVPNVQIPPVQAPFAGQTFNVTSYNRPNYAPLSVNFVVDNNFKNYWILWKWLTILNDPIQGVYTGTKAQQETWKSRLQKGLLLEYQTNFSVYGLNEYNEKTIQFSYYNAFITNLGGIEYNYRQPELIESTVEFQFSQLDIKLLK